MKKILMHIFLSVIFSSIFGCSDKTPLQEDYIGVYRIIKIIENTETIKSLPLNQIELTENYYISSIDSNGDNKFSEEEISKSTYLFSTDEKDNPYISITGNESIVMLIEDDYYDLLFKRVDVNGRVTTIYMRKVR